MTKGRAREPVARGVVLFRKTKAKICLEYAFTLARDEVKQRAEGFSRASD